MYVIQTIVGFSVFLQPLLLSGNDNLQKITPEEKNVLLYFYILND